MMENNLEEIKKFLTAMSKTKTWIKFENLADILPEEQYTDFSNAKRECLKNYYLTINNSEAVRKQIDELVQENLDKDIYGVSLNEEGEFFMQEISSSDTERIIGKIDLEKIDPIKLAKIVEVSMQEQLNFNSFQDNGVLTAEELPKVLEEYITLAQKYQIENENQKVVSANDIASADKEMALTTSEVKGFKKFWQKLISKFKGKDKDEK